MLSISVTTRIARAQFVSVEDLLLSARRWAFLYTRNKYATNMHLGMRRWSQLHWPTAVIDYYQVLTIDVKG